MYFHILDASEWAKFSESAHLVCFNEIRPLSLDRIDYAFLITKDEEPIAYATVREIDANTGYLQYGGAFPNIKNTVHSWGVYSEVIKRMKQTYIRTTTYVENTNIVMLKFALKAGGIITGLRVFEGSILLEITFN